MGAAPAQLDKVADNTDGTAYSVFFNYSFSGFAAGYGIDTGPYLNAYGRHKLLAFDLADGTEVWRYNLPVVKSLLAFDVTGGRVTLLADGGRRQDGVEELLVLDAATGDERENLDTGIDVAHERGDLADLLTHEDVVMLVRWGVGVRPFSAYARG